MSLKFVDPLRSAFRFRLTLWYSTMFTVSCLILLFVSYFFLSSSIGNNRRAIRSKVIEYQSVIITGGVAALEQHINGKGRRPSRRTSFYVRISDPENNTVFISDPRLWENFDMIALRDRPAEGQWLY